MVLLWWPCEFYLLIFSSSTDPNGSTMAGATNSYASRILPQVVYLFPSRVVDI